MKPVPALLFLTLVPLSAQTLNQHDREYGMSQLHATRKMFLDAISGLSPAQWTFKPAPDRWSVAEVAEHVALSEDFMFGRVQHLLKTPATPGKKSPADDEELYRSAIDRSRKARSDEPSTQPTGRFATPAAATAYFRPKRDRTIAYVETSQDPLRAHFDARSGLDAYQWLILIAAHTERHVAQINEVKADPRFPKK